MSVSAIVVDVVVVVVRDGHDLCSALPLDRVIGGCVLFAAKSSGKKKSTFPRQINASLFIIPCENTGGQSEVWKISLKLFA